MYKIGELSRFCKIPVKTLRYYDEEGLLVPDKVDKFTGYRYYSASKLVDCNTIITMKELGFSLSEIKKQLQVKDNNQLLKLLSLKEEQLMSIKIQTETRLKKITQIKENITRENKKMFNVVIQDTDSFRIAYIRKVIKNKDHAFQLINEIKQSIPNNYLGKRSIIINYETEYTEINLDLKVGVEITNSLSNNLKYNIDIVVFPNTTATVVCNNEVLDDAYQALHEFLSDDYQIIGAFYEIYHEDKTVEIKVPVCPLSQEKNHQNDIIDMTFENDEGAIGKWEFFDCVPTSDHFNPNKIKNSIEPWLKEIYFLPHGKRYWVIGWTKGYLYTKSNYPYQEYKNSYTIKEIKDQIFMFINMKTYEYESRGGKPVVWIFKKVNNDIKEINEIRVYDHTDFPFEIDETVIGNYKVVDFVEEKSDFDPNRQNFMKDGLYFLNIRFEENGECFCKYNKSQDEEFKAKWTKGLVLYHQDHLAEHYEFHNIDGEEYLFIEWKSGDYQYGGRKPCYYVFKRNE